MNENPMKLTGKSIINPNNYKLVFFFTAVILLGLLQFLCKDAGISGDEEKHRQQAINVYNFYATYGKDTSALNYVYSKDPMQYNGQSFDLIAYCVEKVFHVTNIYEMRHHLNALAGWLIILFAGLIATELMGYGAGIGTMLLLFISPFFLGHSFNNNKDIPFALGIIMSVFFIIKYFRQFPKPKLTTIVLLIFSIALSISIRMAGIIVIGYLGLCAILFIIRERRLNKKNQGTSKKLFSRIILISILGYFFGIVLWPYALVHPIAGPLIIFGAIKEFPISLGQIFEGKLLWSDQIPWYYLSKYILITVPIVVITGFLLFIILSKHIWTKNNWVETFLILFITLFPIVFSSVTTSSDYGGWRHFLFIYPSLVICSVAGFNALLKLFDKKLYYYLVLSLIVLLSIRPVIHIIQNHPLEYVYYNEIAGGVKRAYGNYEMDYFQNSPRQASKWLLKQIKERTPEKGQKIIIASNCSVKYFFRNDADKISTVYYKYNYSNRVTQNYDWDYMILCNTYIDPFLLKHNYFPPANTICEIKIDGVPVCVVLERKQKYDYQAYQYQKAKDFKKANELYDQALAIEPKNIDILMQVLTFTYMNKNWEKFKEMIDYSLSVYPNYPEFLNFKGILYMNSGRLKEAINTFYYIVQDINPDYFKAYANLGICCVMQKDYYSAVDYFSKCIELNRDYEEGYIYKARVLHYLGRDEEADELLRKEGLVK
jgi:hypothetical protein